MSGEQRFTRQQMLAKLAPYKCKLLLETPMFELWESGWVVTFTLYPENGLYDEFQYRRFLYFVSRTMPPFWNSGGS